MVLSPSHRCHIHPHPRRVAAWSTALLLHMVLLAIALAPPLPLPVIERTPPAEPIMVDIIPARIEEPVPIPREPELVPPVQRQEPVATAPVLAPTGIQRAALAPDRPVFIPARPVLQPQVPPLGAARGLTQAIAVVDVTPPPYPGIALRRGEEGTVLLSVLVGADGVPRAAEVIEGSGSRTLDRAAREHVLAQWRFHPALRDGEPVAARVRVPIEFSLR